MQDNDTLHPMVDIVIDKIISYLYEALECNTLILAAIFHPGLRVKRNSHYSGMGSKGNNCAEEILRLAFTEEHEELKVNNQPEATPPQCDSTAVDSFGLKSNPLKR